MYSNRRQPRGAQPRTGSSHSPPSEWRGDPLPRGRHKVSRKVVRASQRERLLEGMLQCVATHGYAATTVQKVAALARVSPNSFYTFFSDKTDCFLALCDDLAETLLGELIAVGIAESEWLEAARKGVRVYLDWWRDRPEITRAAIASIVSLAGATLLLHLIPQPQTYRGDLIALTLGGLTWAILATATLHLTGSKLLSQILRRR